VHKLYAGLRDAMTAGNDNFDNKHANTQVPKAVGFQRIAELSHNKNYAKAGSFFWETVTGSRSLAFGGNCRREFFPSVSSCTDFVNDVEGPETCNSYNMLKLTEDLFRVNPQAKYTDYYERTMYNHILSTQHPEHGGYVYFTPARPRHYRVYSAPNKAMWCCVGSGMENHGKYNQFIYTRQNDSLFLNLFVASELNWKEKGLTVRQETDFPYAELTKLKITEGLSHFTLMIRYPSWVAEGALKITVNGQLVTHNPQPSSYVPNYIAILHGPILLGAKTGSEDVKGLIADDIHDSRYMIYWMWLTESQYKTYIDSLATVEKERIELQKRTIDFVAPGEQQPEVDHQIEKQKSNTGNIAGAVYDIRLVRK
jgi:hypothetical protein